MCARVWSSALKSSCLWRVLNIRGEDLRLRRLVLFMGILSKNTLSPLALLTTLVYIHVPSRQAPEHIATL